MSLRHPSALFTQRRKEAYEAGTPAGYLALRGSPPYRNTRAYRRASAGAAPMLQIDIEQEIDGRWLAECRAVPCAMAYGETPAAARAQAEALALRVLAERVENGEP